MLALDSLFRGIAIGIVLLLAGGFWRARPGSAFARIGVTYTAGVVAYLLWGDPTTAAWRPALRLLIGLLALSAPFFFWALTRSIFEDGFRLRRVHWLWLAFIEILAIGRVAAHRGWVPWPETAFDDVFHLLALALVLQALWIVWREGAGDLVERRAGSRRFFVAVAGIVAVLVLLLAFVYGPAAQRPPGLQFAEAVGLLIVNLLLGTQLLRFDADFLPPQLPAPPVIVKAGLDAEDSEALARLDALMAREQAWRETGLTIGRLATRLGVPEYRLRRLINRQLGFRNFTAFLNEYRLAAAATRLADPAELRLPVLSIALDLGWASIGPFNRAFRARFDMTPSEYRRRRTGTPADS